MSLVWPQKKIPEESLVNREQVLEASKSGDIVTLQKLFDNA